jgi:hypothetical protein
MRTELINIDLNKILCYKLTTNSSIKRAYEYENSIVSSMGIELLSSESSHRKSIGKSCLSLTQ